MKKLFYKDAQVINVNSMYSQQPHLNKKRATRKQGAVLFKIILAFFLENKITVLNMRTAQET